MLGKHKSKINFAAVGNGRRKCIQRGNENKKLGRNSPKLAVLTELLTEGAATESGGEWNSSLEKQASVLWACQEPAHLSEMESCLCQKSQHVEESLPPYRPQSTDCLPRLAALL